MGYPQLRQHAPIMTMVVILATAGLSGCPGNQTTGEPPNQDAGPAGPAS